MSYLCSIKMHVKLRPARVVSAKTKGTLYTTKTKVLLRNSKVLLRNSLPLNIITPTSELSIFERATSYRLEVQ